MNTLGDKGGKDQLAKLIEGSALKHVSVSETRSFFAFPFDFVPSYEGTMCLDHMLHNEHILVSEVSIVSKLPGCMFAVDGVEWWSSDHGALVATIHIVR